MKHCIPMFSGIKRKGAGVILMHEDTFKRKAQAKEFFENLKLLELQQSLDLVDTVVPSPLALNRDCDIFAEKNYTDPQHALFILPDGVDGVDAVHAEMTGAVHVLKARITSPSAVLKLDGTKLDRQIGIDQNMHDMHHLQVAINRFLGPGF